MTLRELMTEYILFAFSEQELVQRFHITEAELPDVPDIDLLEIYDQTFLMTSTE